MSPLRGSGILFSHPYLGLTPQATQMPPLRGWLGKGLELDHVLLGLQTGGEGLPERLLLLGGHLLRLLMLLLDLLLRLLRLLPAPDAPPHQAGGRADGGALAGVARDPTDQGSRPRPDDGALGAGALAGFGRLLLRRLRLLRLLLSGLLHLEGIDAGVADRPFVARGLVARLPVRGLSLRGEDVDADGGGQRLGMGRLRLALGSSRRGNDEQCAQDDRRGPYHRGSSLVSRDGAHFPAATAAGAGVQAPKTTTPRLSRATDAVSLPLASEIMMLKARPPSTPCRTIMPSSRRSCSNRV